jgi:hypothetical protein
MIIQSTALLFHVLYTLHKTQTLILIWLQLCLLPAYEAQSSSGV